MAIDIKLQHGGACLTVTLTGSIGLTESREVLQQIVTMDTSSRNHPILLDVQATECKLSLPDIVALVADLRDYRSFLVHKIGILYNKKQQEKAARFLELCATNRGYPVRAFTVFEDAMKWLSNTTKVS